MTGGHRPDEQGARGSAFVVMPFDRTFDALHHGAIRPALEALGLLAERYDDAPRTGSVLDEMRRGIGDARLVIAVLTGRNPHVFLELGITLAYRKPCVLLAASADEIPDFLRGLPHVVYAHDPAAAFNGLVERLPALLAAREPGAQPLARL
jgi:hypothetical protein